MNDSTKEMHGASSVIERVLREGPVDHADERTIRRIHEAQAGGSSSAQSAARYARGENPGGLHHKMAHHEGPEHQRPGLDEPQARDERCPGHEYHIGAMRRG